MNTSGLTPELLHKAKAYSAPPEAKELLEVAPVLMIVGPSGVGKDSNIRGLIEYGGYSPVVSTTTRQPRNNDGVPEIPDVDYHFVSFEEMSRLLDEKKLIEANPYNGNIYGVTTNEIRQAYDLGLTALGNAEVQGVAKFKEIAGNGDMRAIFLLPPSLDALKQRLESRGMTQEDIDKRLSIAREEIETALNANYYNFVVNDDLDECIRRIDMIACHHKKVVEDEKAAQARQLAEQILAQLVD